MATSCKTATVVKCKLWKLRRNLFHAGIVMEQHWVHHHESTNLEVQMWQRISAYFLFRLELQNSKKHSDFQKKICPSALWINVSTVQCDGNLTCSLQKRLNVNMSHKGIWVGLPLQFPWRLIETGIEGCPPFLRSSFMPWQAFLSLTYIRGNTRAVSGMIICSVVYTHSDIVLNLYILYTLCLTKIR